MITALHDTAEGAYLVQTESGSTYLLDLDASPATMTRVRDDEDPYHELRRDTLPVELITIEHCHVGAPAILIINLRVPDVAWTLRRTTPVVSIRKAGQQHGR